MARDTLGIDDIHNGPNVVPGVGGWDTVLNDFMAEMRAGRLAQGLLARHPNAIIPGGSSMNVLIAPPGWYVVPWLVGVFSISDLSWSSDDWDIRIKASEVFWATDIQMDDMNAGGALTPHIMFIGPRPGANLNFGTASPQAFPVMDGDDTELDTLAIYGQSGGDSPPCDILVWGMAWPKDDGA